MNAAEKEVLKSELLKTKQEVNERIHTLQLDKTRAAGAVSQDFDEQAQEIENDEVVDYMEQLELTKLKRIEKALRLIDHDTYGICVECGDTISKKRLMAVPYATKCIECSALQ